MFSWLSLEEESFDKLFSAMSFRDDEDGSSFESPSLEDPSVGVDEESVLPFPEPAMKGEEESVVPFPEPVMEEVE